ncbi:MAG: dihydrodipicolinate synthase family protein [candidate division NC10 bacterium]|nr:dihydrodipicolinate synthase family protein [candidate division NC10 bacterium]
MGKTRYVLDGIVPILQTPFGEDGRVDPLSLHRLVDHVIQAGAVGVIYPAVASEVHKLTPAERQDTVEVVLDHVRGRVPVIVGVSTGSAEESLTLARHAQARRATGILAQAPEAMGTDSGQLRAYFRTLARGVDLPLMIQDLDWRGGGMDLALICELFEELPTFRGIKVETVPAGPKYSRILAATGGRLHVSGGWAVTQMLDGLERGVHALMPEGSMVAIYRAIMARHRAGDREGARHLFERLLPILAFANQHIDISIQFFKRVLVAKGVFRTHAVREPILRFDDVQQRIATSLVGRVLELERSLG